MGITLANNAHTTLSADASSTDTVIYVEDIDSFPTLDVGDYFYLTLERTSGAQEIVKVTQINASSFNVERGAESTIPISFPIGSMAKLNMTVQNITDLILTGSNINDDAYGSGWDGDTADAPSRNAVYDKFVTVDASLAGLVSDTAYAGSWNAVTTIAPSKNAVYDAIEAIPATEHTWTATQVFHNSNWFGSGASNVQAQIVLNGGSGTAAGPVINGYQLSLPKWSIGSYETVIGGSDPDLVLYTNTSASPTPLSANVYFYDGAKRVIYRANGTDVALADGGTGASLTDPNADRIMFWDDSAGQVTWLTPNSPLSISGTGLNWSTSALSVGGSGSTTATADIGHNAGGGASASLMFSAAGNSAWTLKSEANTNDNLTLTADNAAGGGAGAGLVLTIPRTTGVAAFAITPTVPDDAYAAGWNGSTQVPTKNAVYDKIEGLSSLYQPLDADLTTWAGLTPSANAQSLVTAADYSAMRTLLGLVPGTDVQAYSSVLATLASEIITSASSTIYLGKQTGASNHYWGIKIDNTAPALGGFVWNLEGVDQWRLNMNYAGTMFLYNPVLASSVYTISPSTNVMAFAVTPTVQDDAYAAGWNGSLEVPTKNAVYDKIQSLGVLSDGDKGDITVSASGATWTIDNNTVTLAKMATMATDSILGRATASTGNVEVLTALPFAFTGDVTRAADSNAQTIANSAVTLAKMANLNQYELIGRSTAGAGAPEAKATSANVWTMLGSADNATIRSNIGLAIGTNVQAYSAILAALAASSNITGTITVSTSAPSGGSSGDVWYERAA